MGRTRTNESNWWRGEGEEVEQEAMKVLTATAKTTLRRLDPDRSNFVEEGDLISEGWLTSMRYAVGGLQQWEARFCMQHMMEEYWRLRHRSFACSRNRGQIVRLSDDYDYPLVWNGSYWGVRCLDLWDLIRVRCTPRQRRMVLARWEGRDRKEIAGQEGLSGGSVRLAPVEVRKHLVNENL